MRPHPRLVAALLAVVACGGALASSTSGSSPMPAPDALACVRSQIKAAGFSQASYDEDEMRVTARKYDDSQVRPDIRFRRVVDRLTVQVSPAAGGDAMSRIDVSAATFAELHTHRGPTEEQERTSKTANDAAQAIVRQCSQRADSAEAPQ